MAVRVPTAGFHLQIFNSTITQIAPAGAALRGGRPKSNIRWTSKRRRGYAPSEQSWLPVLTISEYLVSMPETG
jgi:hypothetical protein